MRDKEMQNMNVKKLAALALVAAGVCSEGAAFAQAPMEQELTTAATDLGHGYDQNYATKNAEAMANLYAADATLVAPSGKIIEGHDNLVDYYKQRFASGATGHHITVVKVFVMGDGGYSLADFNVMSPDKQRHLHKESGHIVAVYERTSGGWRFKMVVPSTAPTKGS
jgi:uncharacterized protein (TIGR02246 family)